MEEERREDPQVVEGPESTGGAATEPTAREADRRMTAFQAVNLQFVRAADLIGLSEDVRVAL